jgi:hypothetical protein
MSFDPDDRVCGIRDEAESPRRAWENVDYITFVPGGWPTRPPSGSSWERPTRTMSWPAGWVEQGRLIKTTYGGTSGCCRRPCSNGAS